MMFVDFEIALAMQFQAETSMRGQLRQHMVEKADSSRHVQEIRHVKIDGNFDCRFISCAPDAEEPLNGVRYCNRKVDAQCLQDEVIFFGCPDRKAHGVCNVTASVTCQYSEFLQVPNQS